MPYGCLVADIQYPSFMNIYRETGIHREKEGGKTVSKPRDFDTALSKSKSLCLQPSHLNLRPKGGHLLRMVQMKGRVFEGEIGGLGRGRLRSTPQVWIVTPMKKRHTMEEGIIDRIPIEM
ncbi:hypothetical protein NPIL_496461 [Nephila pilipes]|uniref:Uncharacterized protein n=1 Tax=Nephila pilipes TaxID=299642 RepID=A0A8X6U6Y0_NEPPI|nr:hypothetical protein NPIL_496461 [Nephila pilipes]